MASAACFGCSLVRWRDKQLDGFFRSCGLRQRSLQIDPETTIACWWNPSEAEAKQGKPALVLIQGFATSSTWQWSQQVKPLQKQFRIFFPDLVFFGKSATASRHRSEIFQAQMVARAMEAMEVSTYSVVGTSYGGFVAFRIAQLFPERVEKVVIANSGVCMTPQDIQELLLRAHLDAVSDLLLPRTPAALRTFLALSIVKAPTFLPSFIFHDMIQYFYIENREERVELLDGLLIGREDTEPLPTLSQKVLIIWGDHDGIFPLELAHRLKEHLKENAELVIFNNTAHCVQMENPKEFNRLVQSFLLGDGVLTNSISRT